MKIVKKTIKKRTERKAAEKKKKRERKEREKKEQTLKKKENDENDRILYTVLLVIAIPLGVLFFIYLILL